MSDESDSQPINDTLSQLDDLSSLTSTATIAQDDASDDDDIDVRATQLAADSDSDDDADPKKLPKKARMSHTALLKLAFPVSRVRKMLAAEMGMSVSEDTACLVSLVLQNIIVDRDYGLLRDHTLLRHRAEDETSEHKYPATGQDLIDGFNKWGLNPEVSKSDFVAIDYAPKALGKNKRAKAAAETTQDSDAEASATESDSETTTKKTKKGLKKGERRTKAVFFKKRGRSSTASEPEERRAKKSKKAHSK
jgi:hypothetical protein